MHSFSQTDRTKKDHELGLALLLSMSSILKEHNIVAAVDLDNLRIDLSEFKLETGNSVLVDLLQRNNSFLHLLATRYGESTLSRLMLRMSLRESNQELMIVLRTFSKQVLEASKAFFNRRIHLYEGGQCIKSVLLVRYMASYVEKIEKQTESCERELEFLNVFPTSQLRSLSKIDVQVDEDIANSLQFLEVADDDFPGQIEMDFLSSLAMRLRTISTLSAQVIAQLRHNLKDDTSQVAQLYCEEMQVLAGHLGSFSMPHLNGLMFWEKRRLLICDCLNQFLVSLQQFSEEFIRGCLSFESFEGAQAKRIPQDIQASLATTMMAKGMDPMRTKDAVSALLLYLEKNDIDASRLLPAELKKIDPQLHPEILEKLQSFGAENALGSDELQKEQQWNRFQGLMKKFESKLKSSGILGLLLLFLASCGVKRAPTSDIQDYRPEIHYKDVSKAAPDGAFSDDLEGKVPDEKQGL